MILARFAPDLDAFAKRMAARAGQLAQARIENAEAERRGDPLRWRKARLLWPLFTKD